MNLDLGSFAFGSFIATGGGTPSWGTSLGQSQPDYKFTYPGAEAIVVGMTYCAVPSESVSLPLGKGGRIYQASELKECVLASLFRKVYINGKKINHPFVMVLIKESSESHSGRRSIKYSNKNAYTSENESYSNGDFVRIAQQTLGLNENACWFVYKFEVYNQDELHMFAVVVDDKESIEYENSSERKNEWLALIPDADKEYVASSSPSLPPLDPSQCTKYIDIITAAKTKPFILLAGISGTGKSRIVKEMAFACCPDVAGLRNDPVSPGNYLLVEVKPNWHDSTELLGYESTIKKGYVLTPFVKFLYKAMKHPDVPFFVCLDEMNLAPVEQYFAEYLSILESRKQQADGTILTEPLIGAEVFRKYPELCAEMNGTAVRRENVKNTYMTTDPAVEYIATEREYENLCEEGLRIPQNVVVIGTVNMDETTHQFSRKVIDRAMKIEMNEVKFDGFFESSSELAYPDSVLPKEYFLPCHTTAGKALESVPDDAEYIKANVPAMLAQLNEALADTPFKIAYRVQNELVLYFAALRQEEAHKATGTAELLATAMDQILMMKVLPRIEGDDELLEKPLERLAVYAEGYPKASAKIKEMQERLGRSHFTSFWP